jgi:hypothetical protein
MSDRVQKFRSIEEMNAAQPPKIEGEPFDRFFRHCEAIRSLSPLRRVPGVFRFRTLEEAQQARLAKN